MTPVSPFAMPVPAAVDSIFLYANSAIAVLAMAATAIFIPRGNRVMSYLLIMSGAACVLNEATVDRLGLCWFPHAPGLPVLYAAFGVSVPLLMLPVYAWYVGGQAVLAHALLRRGVTAAGVMGFYAACSVTNFILEAPGLNLGVYAYYGNQPLRLLMFPCWWAVANALMPLGLAACATKLAPQLGGWRRIIIVAAGPPIALAANAVTVSPVWFTLNARLPLWTNTVAACISLGLSLGIVRVIAGIFGTDLRCLAYLDSGASPVASA